MTGTGRFEPAAVTGSTKYGPEGLYSTASFDHMDLPSDLKNAMVTAANHSLAKKTWQSYKTASKHLKSCETETGIKINFPMSERDTTLFLSWLLVRRGVKASAADCYLSAVRQVHMVQGLPAPDLRQGVVKSIIKGGKNQDTTKERINGKRGRLPVTITILKLLKHEIAEAKLPYSTKRLVWLICTLNFFGCFRIHETLARSENTFDPAFTLLARDVELKQVKIGDTVEQLLQLRLKSPKEDRVGASIFVDVYETGSLLCPVRAYKKWMLTRPPTRTDLPAFRKADGVPLTGRELNKILKTCLEKHEFYQSGTITSHSFRSGMASLMATLGYSEEEIMAMGRWSSSAFETYIKLPRRKRSEMAKDIGRRI